MNEKFSCIQTLHRNPIIFLINYNILYIFISITRLHFKNNNYYIYTNPRKRYRYIVMLIVITNKVLPKWQLNITWLSVKENILKKFASLRLLHNVLKGIVNWTNLESADKITVKAKQHNKQSRYKVFKSHKVIPVPTKKIGKEKFIQTLFSILPCNLFD